MSARIGHTLICLLALFASVGISRAQQPIDPFDARGESFQPDVYPSMRAALHGQALQLISSLEHGPNLQAQIVGKIDADVKEELARFLQRQLPGAHWSVDTQPASDAL